MLGDDGSLSLWDAGTAKVMAAPQKMQVRRRRALWSRGEGERASGARAGACRSETGEQAGGGGGSGLE